MPTLTTQLPAAPHEGPAEDLGAAGDILEGPGGSWRFLEGPGGSWRGLEGSWWMLENILEGPEGVLGDAGKHPGGSFTAPGGCWRHPGRF